MVDLIIDIYILISNEHKNLISSYQKLPDKHKFVCVRISLV